MSYTRELQEHLLDVFFKWCLVVFCEWVGVITHFSCGGKTRGIVVVHRFGFGNCHCPKLPKAIFNNNQEGGIEEKNQPSQTRIGRVRSESAIGDPILDRVPR